MDEVFRKLAAEQGAHSYLIGFLLKYSFRDLEADQIPEIAEHLKKQIRRTPASLTGATAGDEERSERLADMIVKMHGYVDTIVDEAAAGAIEVVSKKKRGR